MGKTMILVHGRSFKPPEKALRDLWIDALRHGIERDRPGKLKKFDLIQKEFVYFGDLSNQFLKRARKTQVPNDLAARKAALEALKRLAGNQFTKRQYKTLPGFKGFKEGLADTFGAALGALHIAEPLIEVVAPDMKEYWNPDSYFGSSVRYQMIEPLKQAMDRGDRILVVSHSLGTIISYDTFWKFSRSSEYRSAYSKKKIDLWITMGSPLGDETVKRNLRGSQARNERRYPSNIKHWVNIAAEDDFISHDQKIANDYKDMKKHKLVDSIQDKRIYNLATKHDKPHQHSSAGYLIHPEVSALVANWI